MTVTVTVMLIKAILDFVVADGIRVSQTHVFWIVKSSDLKNRWKGFRYDICML